MQLHCPLSTEGFQPRGCQNALNKSPGIVLSLPEVCSQLGRAGRWGEAAHESPEGNGLGRDRDRAGDPGSAQLFSSMDLPPSRPFFPLRHSCRAESGSVVLSRGAGSDLQE